MVNRESGAIERTIDLFQQFGIPRPPTVDWPILWTRNSLTTSDIWLAPVPKLVTDVQHRIADLIGGLPMTGLGCVCGSQFFDAIAAAPELRDVALATPQAATLNEPVFGLSVTDAGCIFNEYRGRIGN